MTKIAFLLAALAATPPAASPSRADGPPGYDVAAYCRLVTNAIGGPASLMGACLEKEEAARRWLLVEWTGVRTATRDRCDAVARSIGGSYDILKGCVEQEAAKTVGPAPSPTAGWRHASSVG